MGSVGKITRLPCEADTALAGIYQLETATPSLNITTATRKIIIDMSCEDGNAKGSINFDYTAGTVTFKGTFNGARANTDGVADSCVDSTHCSSTRNVNDKYCNEGNVRLVVDSENQYDLFGGVSSTNTNRVNIPVETTSTVTTPEITILTDSALDTAVPRLIVKT